MKSYQINWKNKGRTTQSEIGRNEKKRENLRERGSSERREKVDGGRWRYSSKAVAGRRGSRRER
jgi:hypothetical protein